MVELDTLFVYILTAIVSVVGLFHYLHTDDLIWIIIIVACVAINFIVALVSKRG